MSRVLMGMFSILDVLDDAAHARFLRGDHRRFPGDGHGLFDAGDHEAGIDREALSGEEGQAFPPVGAEAGHGHLDRVVAGIEGRKNVDARRVGGGLRSKAGIDVRRHHRRSGKDRALRVGHFSADAVRALRQNGGNEEERERGECEQAS